VSVVALTDSEPALRRTIRCLQCGHILACHSPSSDQSSLFSVAFSGGSPIHASSNFLSGNSLINFIGKRKKFIFNAFVDLKPVERSENRSDM